MKNKVQELIPIGYVHSIVKSYYLIRPTPLLRDWEDTMCYRFQVVPFGTTPNLGAHQCPREVVFACDFLVEYTTDIPAIECEFPYDILDKEEDEIITTEYENSIKER